MCYQLQPLHVVSVSSKSTDYIRCKSKMIVKPRWSAAPFLWETSGHVVRTQVPQPRQFRVAHPDCLAVRWQQLLAHATLLASSIKTQHTVKCSQNVSTSSAICEKQTIRSISLMFSSTFLSTNCLQCQTVYITFYCQVISHLFSIQTQTSSMSHFYKYLHSPNSFHINDDNIFTSYYGFITIVNHTE